MAQGGGAGSGGLALGGSGLSHGSPNLHRVRLSIGSIDVQAELFHALEEAGDAEAVVAPRRWSEIGFAVSTLLHLGLVWATSSGDATAVSSWELHAIVLALVCVSGATIFVGNTHIRLLAYLVARKVTIGKLLALSLADLVIALIYPERAGGLSTAIQTLAATTRTLVRLLFIVSDSLMAASHTFRMLFSFIFLAGNLHQVYAAYFFHAADPIVVIPRPDGHNMTLTTSAVSAGIGSAMISVSAFALLTMWQDRYFLYVALCQADLPKHAVDSRELAEDGDDEGWRSLAAEYKDAHHAWLGGLVGGEIVCVASAIIYVAHLVCGAESVGLRTDESGSESAAFIVSSVTAFVLMVVGSALVFWQNVSWLRLNYVFTSSKGVLLVFYLTCFLVVGFVVPDTRSPVSSRLSMCYVFLGYVMWYALDSAKRVSRTFRAVQDVCIILNMFVAIVFSLYVWSYDPSLGDLNGESVPGEVTKLQLWRICYWNLLVLLVGSLRIACKDWQSGQLMHGVGGYVLRSDILRLESVWVSKEVQGDTAYAMSAATPAPPASRAGDHDACIDMTVMSNQMIVEADC